MLHTKITVHPHALKYCMHPWDMRIIMEAPIVHNWLQLSRVIYNLVKYRAGHAGMLLILFFLKFNLT